MGGLKLKALEETKKFYLWKLKEESLGEGEKSKYLLALKSIERIITGKERSRGRRKNKKFRSYEHKKIFQNSRRRY
ncbi:unnamed protein product [marine sediment metagenome]|uniref:Uncharacterized protein n=1 Tax=marine sediment metagenome TaxID=412755 RepID=X1Q5P1_9ZZZZ